ncbi:MAG: ABC transporter permease subunit [Gammaproteobacteria bacterium]|nr:ABC transporter permease subunit [Gammaproteobacteria bacterium]
MRKYFDNRRLGRIFIYTILALFAAYSLFPLYIMVITSFKTMAEIRGGGILLPPGTLNLESWTIAWSGSGECTQGVACTGMKGYFANTLLMVIPAVGISTLLGALNGYVLTKWRFRGSNLLFGMLLLGCFIPFQVILLPMAQVLGQLGLSGSLVGLTFVHVVYGLAFTSLFFRNYYITVPSELIQAARIDGAGFWRIFLRIILPISAPVFVVSVIWQFTQIWNDFLFGVVYSDSQSQPIMVALNNLVNTSTGVKRYNVDMAGALIAGLPTLIVYVIAGKFFVRGLTSGAVKG